MVVKNLLPDNAIRIGLMSRIDYGASGYRQGLLALAGEVFQKIKPHILVIAGGLISYPELKKRIFSRAKKERMRELEDLIESCSQDLAAVLPSVHRNGERVKIYIVLSPSPNYDGPWGHLVASRLSELRDDIRLLAEPDNKIPLYQPNKTMMVLTPVRSQWATKYYSTPVERLIFDKEQQGTRAPDFYVVGCFAASLLKPKGEMRPYIAVPALHRLEGVVTAENQIGVKWVDVFPQEIRVSGYSFKDFVSPEQTLIVPSREASSLQKRIIRKIAERGPLTEGMLARELWPKSVDSGKREQALRDKIKIAIDAYLQSNLEPWLDFDEPSKRYFISQSWLQKRLRYSLPKNKHLKCDSILVFGCLHAGAVSTDYKFFRDRLPEIILEHDVKYIVGAGDFIQGLRHSLLLKREVIDGFNITDQEHLAASLISHVLMKVFSTRFKQIYQRENSPDQERLREIIADCFPYFIFIPGNHDEWQEEEGITPLAYFQEKLKESLCRATESLLASYDLFLKDIAPILYSKIIALEFTKAPDKMEASYTLPSGICFGVIHPHMARAQTSSLRAQAMLRQSSCQVVLGANFHVGIVVEQWMPEYGQRISVLVGAFVRGTKFEWSKLKGSLDFGPAILKLKSMNGRILMSEVAFVGEPTDAYYNFTIRDFLKTLDLED